MMVYGADAGLGGSNMCMGTMLFPTRTVGMAF